MRLALLTAITTVAGLAACAPVPGPYGYAPGPNYGYSGGAAYAPNPYYAEPAYAPGYVTPGPAIIVGGERRFDDGDRYRSERQRNEGAYRNNQPPPNRDYGRGQPQQNYGGNRPGPTPVAVARPAPQPSQRPSAPPPPSGGAAFERWNRANVNASPPTNDAGGSR